VGYSGADDSEAEQDELARTWYATSLHCLYRGDCLRNYDIRTVQTVVILGMCFNNFGDFGLYKTLRACAIRVAHELGLDKRAVPDAIQMEPELCHRMWWTLVICDW
jgi:hypothetical protein